MSALPLPFRMLLIRCMTLPEAEAVELLLGTAEVTEPTGEQAVASQKLVERKNLTSIYLHILRIDNVRTKVKEFQRPQLILLAKGSLILLLP